MRLYPDEARFGRIFANLHARLNAHFEAINGRANTTKHYWADNSRDLLTLIGEVPEALFVLQQAGIDVRFAPEYQAEIERCKPWLANSGGSTVPDDFTPISVIKYSPVFVRPDATVRLRKNGSNQSLHLIGEGSYAKVFSFEDPDYGIRFALKRAKPGLPERDLYRFREEFRILKSLSHPYLVEVYQYDEARNEYKMEFCDETCATSSGGATPVWASTTARESPCSFSTASTSSTGKTIFTAMSASRTSCSRRSATMPCS